MNNNSFHNTHRTKQKTPINGGIGQPRQNEDLYGVQRQKFRSFNDKINQ